MTTKSTIPSQSLAETFSPGGKLADTFTLQRKISSGETGVVWLARDEELEQDVAMHFLPDPLMFDPRALDELRAEVRHNRQLIHPNVVRVYDLVEGPGWAAITSDCPDAETLASLQAKKNGGVFAPPEIAPWITSLCQTLDDAHRANLIHGDLTPENILLSKSGKILLANFGVSRIIREALNRAQPESAARDLPRTSPQQLDGEQHARWDDVYAVGILFHSLLAGKPPFEGDDIVQQIRRTPPPSVSERRAALGIQGEDVPKKWEPLIAACLEKHTDKRLKTAREVGDKLDTGIDTPDEIPRAAEPAKAADFPKPAADAPASKFKSVLDESLLWEGKKTSAEKPAPEKKSAPFASSVQLPKKPFLEKMSDEPSFFRGKIFIRTAAVLLTLIGVILLIALPKKKAAENKTAATAGVPSATPGAVAKSGAQPSATASPQSTAVAVATPRKITLPQGALTVEQAHKALVEAEKVRLETSLVQQAAEADVLQTQKAIDEKIALAAQLKKNADETAALRKQHDEDERKAAADAEEAKKAAAEKARLAEASKKAGEQILAQSKEQEAAQQKLDAELQGLQKAAADKQRVAGDAAQAALVASAQYKQMQDILIKTQAQDDAAKAAVLAAEKARADQAPAAAAAKAGAQQTPGATPLTPITPVAPDQGTTPDPLNTAPLLALNQASPTPVPTPTPVPSPTPFVANPRSEIDRKLQNSLGMKFVPVDDVLFCIWHARVQDFEVFAKATGFKGNSWQQPGFKQGPDHPVVNVTWNDAIAFCKWLTDKEHKEGLLAPDQFYRLPTDLEWSKAVGLPAESGRTPEARDIGVPDVYPWGTQWPPPQGAGNYTGEETGSDVAIKNYDDGYSWTSPVGSFTPNKYGLYDMGGNAWQWCMDWLNGAQKYKVLRGASWYNGGLKLSLLSSCRLQAAPDFTTDNFGFRVVIASDAKSRK